MKNVRRNTWIAVFTTSAASYALMGLGIWFALS